MLPRARYEQWEDLVPNLQVGDIVLFQGTYLASQLIRGITGSYWSHVGMVFDIMHPDAENRIALVIEALDRIEIHRLRIYMNRYGIKRIGVKRFPGLTEEQRQHIRGFFLETIDVPYDWNRVYTFFLSGLLARISNLDVTDYLTKRGVTPENFVCSTFVQRAFYLALPPGERDRAIFLARKNLNLLEKLEVCTPADIARSTNTEWLWNPHH